MNAIVQKSKDTKNFVKKHRVAIAVTVTSAFWINAMMKGNAQHNEFLKAHGLYEQFYTETLAK